MPTIVKWYGTDTDIEDRRRTEDALRESEQRFRDYAEIQADLEDVLCFFDVNRKPKSASETGHWSADKVVRIPVEIVMVVLDEASDPVGEGVFTTEAKCPTAASGVQCSDGTTWEEVEGELISLK
jgi:hypothetical protein